MLHVHASQLVDDIVGSLGIALFDVVGNFDQGVGCARHG